MFKIDKKTLWWSPTPELVVDARDIVKIEVGAIQNIDGALVYRLIVNLSNSDKIDLMYPSLEKLNEVLSILGLTWE